MVSAKDSNTGSRALLVFPAWTAEGSNPSWRLPIFLYERKSLKNVKRNIFC